MITQTDLFDEREAARRLGLSVATMRRRRLLRRPPAWVKLGGRVLYRALELDAPNAVIAEAGAINPETYPAWAHITYSFPNRGKKSPVALHWYEGARDGSRVLPST